MIHWKLYPFLASKGVLGNITASKRELKGCLFSEKKTSVFQCTIVCTGILHSTHRLGCDLVSRRWKVCVPGAPQHGGSGPALLRVFSRMMRVFVLEWECLLLSTEIANVIASKLCATSAFQTSLSLSFNVAEFCMNRTSLGTGQIRRIFFQIFYINRKMTMLAMLSFKKMIKCVTLGDMSCFYTR